MDFRRYIPDTDEEAVCRIWEECGWLDLQGKNKDILPSYRAFLDCSDAEVALSGGEAECLVTTHSGTITMLDTELSLESCNQCHRRQARPASGCSRTNDRQSRHTCWGVGGGMRRPGYFRPGLL